MITFVPNWVPSILPHFCGLQNTPDNENGLVSGHRLLTMVIIAGRCYGPHLLSTHTFTFHMHSFSFIRLTRSSSWDETANVNFFTTTAYTHYKLTTLTGPAISPNCDSIGSCGRVAVYLIDRRHSTRSVLTRRLPK